MAKKYCPLDTALNLFREPEKLVDFTMNCRSLYFRLQEIHTKDFNFSRFTNAIAELTRVNENLRTAYANWEEDNRNITPNHIQFLGVSKNYLVFHFGYIRNEKYYIEFSVKNEGNDHYVLNSEYDYTSNNEYSFYYSLSDIYEQLKDLCTQFIETQKEKAIQTYLEEKVNEDINEEENECEKEYPNEEICSCEEDSCEEEREEIESEE